MRNSTIKVTSVRYFETRRGIGYQCETNLGFEIWNDGDGGGTYATGAGVLPNRTVREILRKAFPDADPQSYEIERELESLINKYEQV